MGQHRGSIECAESLIEDLEAPGAFNDETIKVLYVNFDKVTMSRLAELGS